MLNGQTLSVLEIALIAVNSVMAGGALWASICATNNMSPGTRPIIRVAYVVLGTASAASLLYPFWYGQPPGLREMMLILGVVTLLYADKRSSKHRPAHS